MGRPDGVAGLSLRAYMSAEKHLQTSANVDRPRPCYRQAMQLPHWRSMPKVCPPRAGASNSKAYRWVKYWQPEGVSVPVFCCLGRMDYVGPTRSTLYMDRGRIHRWHGAYLVAWWHEHGPPC